MTYRPDIDGLRAIAVLAVMLFHFGVPGFSGGYVGVDIFFVISGFLITGIIHREVSENRFSIASFYERRIRRIFPALFAVFIFTLIAGGLIFLPENYQDYSASLLTSTLFMSNILFWLEAGYFDSASEMKPLLHTWSLSVEEQFYILFPPLLLLISTYGQKKYVPIILGFAILSFFVGLWQITEDREAAFYLIHTRFWELALGSLLALGLFKPSSKQVINQTCSVIGIALILYAVHFLDKDTLFPGAYALLPCAGTALIIYSGSATLINRLFSFKPIVAIGLISYSLYLWHWPLFVYFNYLTLRAPDALEISVLFALSFLLAGLSWRYIEQPFRTKPYKHTRGHIFLYGISAMLVMVFISNIIFTNQGLPIRLPSDTRQYFTSEYKYQVLENRDIYECLGDKDYNPDGVTDIQNDRLCPLGVLKENQSPQFILWGDSHAETLRAGFHQLAKDYNTYGVFAGYGSCPGILNLQRYDDLRDECVTYNQAILDYIQRHDIKHVVLSARWASVTSGKRYKADANYRIYLDPNRDLSKNPEIFQEKLSQTIKALKEQGRHVYIISSIPEVGHNVFLYYIRSQHMNFADLDIQTLRPSLKDFLERNKLPLDYFETLEDVDVIHPYKHLCSEGYCSIMAEDTPLYRDNDHLSRHGSLYLTPVLKPIFLNIENAD